MAHQWFYSLVGNDQAEEAWLDEGLTSFITHLYEQKKEENSRPKGKEYGSRVEQNKIPEDDVRRNTQKIHNLTGLAATSTEDQIVAAYSGKKTGWENFFAGVIVLFLPFPEWALPLSKQELGKIAYGLLVDSTLQIERGDPSYTIAGTRYLPDFGQLSQRQCLKVNNLCSIKSIS